MTQTGMRLVNTVFVEDESKCSRFPTLAGTAA
jgi:hypothetical protein